MTTPKTAAPTTATVLDREEKYLLAHFASDCGIMPGDIQGSFHRIRETIAARPQCEVQTEGDALIEAIAPCKGEHSKFEAWAAAQNYDMSEHPIHYLFTSPKTYAARQGWKAALEYVSSLLSSAQSESPAPSICLTCGKPAVGKCEGASNEGNRETDRRLL